MRKMMTAVLALSAALPVLAVPGMANAQSGQEVRQDQRDLHQQQRELRDAQRRGDRGDIRDERRDVRDARRELHEDWQDYRQSHRDVYRRPAYAGPRGYRYAPVAAGHRFDRSYYADRYWVRDYGRYRLAPPPRGQRWVRYGNDVVLVNVRTGRVVTVHNRFFY